MSKDYLKYDIEKTKMTEDDFEILKNYYEEDEIDNIEYQMNLDINEYPRVDKYVCDDITFYLLFHSLDEDSNNLAYITVNAVVNGVLAVTSKMVQVGSTFSEEESDEVLKVLRELLQEEYSAMRQFLYGAKNVTIATSQNRAKRLRENLCDEDVKEGSEHRGCLKALLFELVYVFPKFRQQHIFELFMKILRNYYGDGVSMCMSTFSSGQEVSPKIAEMVGEKTGFTVSNDFLHIATDTDVKFTYYLDEHLVQQARMLHTV